jgi:hypothetical protein
MKEFNTIVNEDRIKKLKSFFFKTIDNEKTPKSGRNEKKCEVRLKNMLEKSNMKKRKLEELFKSREWIDESSIERTINANKIHHLITDNSTKTLSSR